MLRVSGFPNKLLTYNVGFRSSTQPTDYRLLFSSWEGLGVGVKAPPPLINFFARALTMSYCLNVNCQEPENPDTNLYCLSCGSELRLKERYRPMKLIGQGGFSRTYLAIDEDKPSHPPCVVKQFYPLAQSTNNAAQAAALFEKEAVRLESLGKHPQIAELLAHFHRDNCQYLVQEFIAGKNLAEVLETEGVFNETQIWELLKSLLPVLEFIHSHSIIHRDIKPENIIRRENSDKDKSKELVLVDFGAAKHATGTALLKTGTIIG